MSYNIGQFKRTQLGVNSPYETLVDKNKYAISDSSDNTSSPGSISMNGDNYFDAGVIYHLSTTLLGKQNNQVRIKLQNGTDGNDFQTIKITKITGNNGKKNIDLIFLPLRKFQKIVFENMDSLSKDRIHASNNINTKIYTMTNIVKHLNLDKMSQIGIQGPEGLIFAINGNQLQIGKSGIFMSEEMEITSLCFVADPSKKVVDENENELNVEHPFFIVDYQYKEEKEI